MDGAKIRLSEEEKRLISSGDWILTKNGILAKVNQLLAGVMQGQSHWMAANSQRFVAALVAASPKISRGENYLGLPWLMLDYPRLFTRNDTCAIRVFFWWGNFFSITLQLAGPSLNRYSQHIINAWQSFNDRNYLLGIADDPWVHHAGTDNYLPVNEMDPADFRQQVVNRGFVKLMTLVSLDDWDLAAEKLEGEFRFLMEQLAD
ncbi:MAG: hypothetical protein EOO05_07790 [Chitinophagaceae bacterium]|nr:MAG: hypothetical protein EOO05_07790 [Chitinophagaceae bacterium]